MIHAVLPTVSAAGEETAERPVTAAERQARWGHRGGVLELSGPAALIDAIERSLLMIGAVPVRIEVEKDGAQSGEFALHPHLLDAVLALQARSGLLTLLVRIREDAALIAHTADQSIMLDIADSNHAPTSAVAAVHRLLYEAGILISPEGMGL